MSAFSTERLAQILLAPVISEKSTFVAEKNEQVVFDVLPDATKPEVKAAVELLFKKSAVASLSICRRLARARTVRIFLLSSSTAYRTRANTCTPSKTKTADALLSAVADDDTRAFH